MSSTDLFANNPPTPLPAAAPSPNQRTPAAGRLIRYGDRRLTDPGPQFDAQQIKEMYIPFFPELGNCKIEEAEGESGVEIRFVKQATTKG
ncbi:MAG: hypothetical protein KDE09_14025 [Anaerolineales bacterium]|nr:hypothetical protein [Anaerolineales bacterium]